MTGRFYRVGVFETLALFVSLLRVFLEPLAHSTCDVGNIGESVLEHPFSGARAADSGGTMDKVAGVAWEVFGSRRPAAEGDEFAAFDMGHGVFVLFADVEEDAFEAILENLAEFEGGDFW